ncbi:MAG: bifunctional N(6)-L-threonylcarbamoyladenine synthase/serine/threonine protein kinase [Thermoplasmatales archaeon]|nr:bifunctional N(6)-L-threonylcarbamoyladenine synthase/serine/threonine protein kinase [Thermoplasmatales archaeon]MCW6170582.1 bifunctional N(6)-L-threonylcarbamoyladenine synthase/serine/threonine protein kinase [Thermoplasmatales archaeon]
MISLGIEGTAHTIGCGIVDEYKILGNSSDTYKSLNGGIHPREAAVHHADHVGEVINSALDKAGIKLSDIDLVSYSKGPGLGPCLRVAATAARAISIKTGKPIIGVNHPLGHVEIGRKLTGAKDPIMLYASGGNTQIIAHINGRYRVMGETMDMGIGNLLDKIGRDLGYEFPGGPVIEKLSLNGNKLLNLPYSIKGMDFSFSGIYTASKQLLKNGERKEDVAYSIQETAFSMIMEVLERGIHQVSKKEILIAGGVARNKRLREMISTLGKELNIKSFLTDDEYCMDNGAMIAQAGMLMFQYGRSDTVETATVDQRFRIDAVDVPWIIDSPIDSKVDEGAESIIQECSFLGRNALRKTRIRKNYRDSMLDISIRKERIKREATLIYKMNELGIPVPIVYDIDFSKFYTLYERIDGEKLSSYLEKSENKATSVIEKLGESIGIMHSKSITHGDLTTSNIIVKNGVPYLIDASMGSTSSTLDELAVDLYLFMESLRVISKDPETLFRSFVDGYSRRNSEFGLVMQEMDNLEKRRRYV